MIRDGHVAPSGFPGMTPMRGGCWGFSLTFIHMGRVDVAHVHLFHIMLFDFLLSYLVAWIKKACVRSKFSMHSIFDFL